MTRFFTLLIMQFVMLVSGMAQVVSGTSSRVTYFDTFQMARITLTNGTVNTQGKANVFLLDSSLLYKKGGKESGQILRANMNLIDNVQIGGMKFVCHEGQLAEVVAEKGNVKLIKIRTIDKEAFENNVINESSYTDISTLLRDQVGFTKVTPSEADMAYPIINSYFYLVGKKCIKNGDRYVKNAMNKSQKLKLESLYLGVFSWESEESMLSVLDIFAE